MKLRLLLLMCVALVGLPGAISADQSSRFPLFKSKVASVEISSGLNLVRLSSFTGKDLEATVYEAVAKRCLDSGYNAAEHVDVVPVKSPISSINTLSGFVLTFECVNHRTGGSLCQ